MKNRTAEAVPCADRPSAPSAAVFGNVHKSSWCPLKSAQTFVPHLSVGTCEESAGAGMAQSPHHWDHPPWHQNPHLRLELRKAGRVSEQRLPDQAASHVMTRLTVQS